MKRRGHISARMREAAEREQRHLADDFHETLCQTLVGVSLSTQLLLRAAKAGKPLKPGELEKIGRYVDEAIDHARLPFQDQSVRLGATPLNVALAKLALLTGRRIPCEFQVEGSGPLAAPISFALYRIALEAVRNVLHHAESTRVVIRLEARQKSVVLEVRDDGCGFKVAAPQPGGTLRGMEVMRDYAESIGATLRVQSTEGKGTSVQCVAPLVE